MSRSTSVRCNICKRKVKEGLAFCSFCGVAVIRIPGLENKTTALFDPGNVDLKPWREPCLIPKRNYVKASDAISHTPWRPIMRQPRVKEIPNELLEKRAALLAFHKKTRENNQHKDAVLPEGVVLFDGIPFKKGGYEFTSAVDNSEIMKEKYAKLARESKNELYYERVFGLGIYDAVWITHQSAAVHVSLLERGIKLAANNIVLSYCRWLQISVTFDWHDSSDNSVVNATDADYLLEDGIGVEDHNGDGDGGRLDAHDEPIAVNVSNALAVDVVCNQIPSPTDNLKDQYDMSDNCIVYAIPDFAGKHMLEQEAAWVELNAINPNEHYMSEYLQVLLKPIANRVKPIGLTIPVLSSVDQISFISSTRFTRKIPYHSSMFDSATENVLHLNKINSLDVQVTGDNLVDIFHGSEIKPIDYESNKAIKEAKKKRYSRNSSPSSRSSSRDNSRPGTGTRAVTPKSARGNVKDQLTDFDKEHQIMENAVAHRASLNIGRIKDRLKSNTNADDMDLTADMKTLHPPYMNYKDNHGLAFDATVYRGHFRIVVGKTKYMDTVNCHVSCQFVMKQPHIIDIEPLTSLAYSKYTNISNIEDAIEYVLIIVTPSPASSIARKLKVKVFKLDLDSIYHICPVIRNEQLFYGREGSDYKKAIGVLTSMMHYDYTVSHGIRLCFHGVNDDTAYDGTKMVKGIWPHEAEFLRVNKAVDIQTMYRGFRTRRNIAMAKDIQFQEMRIRAASLVISRMMAGHAGRQKARKRRAQQDQYLRELELKYSREEDLKISLEMKKHHSNSILEPQPEVETDREQGLELGLESTAEIESELSSNEIETLITDTNVILSGEFLGFDGDFEQLLEFPLQWECIHLIAQDKRGHLKAKLTLERTNIVYEKVLTEFNSTLSSMNESEFLHSEFILLKTNKFLLERKFLTTLSMFLKIFIAREKGIMLLKVDYDNI